MPHDRAGLPIPELCPTTGIAARTTSATFALPCPRRPARHVMSRLAAHPVAPRV